MHADKLKLFDKASRHTASVWINKSKPNAYLEAIEMVSWGKKYLNKWEITDIF